MKKSGFWSFFFLAMRGLSLRKVAGGHDATGSSSCFFFFLFACRSLPFLRACAQNQPFVLEYKLRRSRFLFISSLLFLRTLSQRW